MSFRLLFSVFCKSSIEINEKIFNQIPLSSGSSIDWFIHSFIHASSEYLPHGQWTGCTVFSFWKIKQVCITPAYLLAIVADTWTRLLPGPLHPLEMQWAPDLTESVSTQKTHGGGGQRECQWLLTLHLRVQALLLQDFLVRWADNKFPFCFLRIC